MVSPNFIIIDGSYFVFFRYYALLNWFKLAKKDEDMEDPFKNETFVEKFRSTFISKMKEGFKTPLKVSGWKFYLNKLCFSVDLY